VWLTTEADNLSSLDCEVQPTGATLCEITAGGGTATFETEIIHRM